MSSVREVAILANPYSGTGPTYARVAALEEALRTRGVPSRVIWDPAERRTYLAEPAGPSRVLCVVAVGGDGTVGDVINEIPAEIPLATLPCGNENLFAREFGFTAGIDPLVAAMLQGQTRRIDLVQCGDRRFSLMLSAGFDAEVTHHVARWRLVRGKLRRVHRLSYALPILKALWNYEFPPLELIADGVSQSGTHGFVFNVSRYAMDLPFAPHARPDNGTLEWVLFRKPGRWSLADYLLSVVRGRHLRRSDVLSGHATHIRLTSPQAVPVQIDGDARGTTPVDLSIVPQALTVLRMDPRE